MGYGNKLRATVVLMMGALFPRTRNGFRTAPEGTGGQASIDPDDFAAALAEPGSLLRPDGTLELHFNGALPIAAPLLLFRLKRTGFSDCRATITPDGILLTARR